MRYRGVELHSDEEVKKFVRQYTARLVTPFAVVFLTTLAAFYLLVPLWNLRISSWDIHTVGRAIFIGSLVAVFIYAFRAYVVWSDTALVVTNQRVIDIDRRGFFDRAVSEVPYQSLSDVSYRSKGMVEMMAGVGSITFQMFSGNENICFEHIMNPAKLHKEILELRVAEMRGAPKEDDPMEEVFARVKKFSPTEQRALLANLKKTVPKKVAPPEREIELP